MKKIIIFYSVIASVFILNGCETAHKQDFGTLLGGVAGGVLGSQIGGGRGQTAAIIAGTIGGAMVGREIGRVLDERDRQALETSTRSAIESGEDNSWSNPESGSSGTVRVVATKPSYVPVDIPVLKDRVASVPPLDLIGEPYVSTTRVNVRGGPGSDYVQVGSLREGQAVQVNGRVRDAPWYMISQGGVATGFVHVDYLKPAAHETAKAQVANETTPEGTVETVQVAVGTQCRTLEQVVTLADGSEHTETISACLTPSGGWQIQEV